MAVLPSLLPVLTAVRQSAQLPQRTHEQVHIYPDQAPEADVANGVINTIDQVVADPQIQAREMIVEVDHPTAGKYKVVNSPFKFSKSPVSVKHGAPVLGADNREIFKGIGLTDQNVDALLAVQAPMRKMFVDYPM
jgi:crotonobetainyl-CoA:carnitine CoA-transferase CaiB-like acyl-CoA transferase